MKKLISTIAAAAIAASVSPVLADNDAGEKLQSVLESVKARIEVPEEYSKFESSENHEGYSSSYYFSWNTEDYDKSMYVSCVEDGIITSYSMYTGYRDRELHMPKMSGDEAKAIAEEFMKKINPNYPYECVLQENGFSSLYNSRYNFPILIYADGVKIQNENGSITVDTETGKVTDFDIWYEPDTKQYFTSAEQFISQEDAKQAYIENFPMELIYRSYYDDDGKEIFYPVYTMTDDYNEYINAVTGEKETVAFYRSSNGFGRMMYDEAAEDAGAMSKASLTPQELAEIENVKGLISKDDIEKQLRENKVLNIPADAKVESIRLMKGRNSDEYTYSVIMHAYDKDGGDSAFINASADALTGTITGYYRLAPGAEVIENKNDETLKALAGSKADEYVYDDDAKVYLRYANGIKVDGNNAYIRYSDGVLTEYSISYSDADFPSIDGVISAEDATKAVFEYTDYDAVCVVGYNADDEACLYPVYSHYSASINPFTGKAVDYRNEEISETEGQSLEYSDISEHYAEKYIKELAKYNIGFDGGEFKPDEMITQADMLTLLGGVTGGGDIIVLYNDKEQADRAYSSAFRNGIINEDERDDNAVITRETASVYLIRAIGAEQYAKYEDIYVTPFEDVTENKGYIALLYAMGVVNGSGDGTFNPKREITRAEFAVMIYNYLNR